MDDTGLTRSTAPGDTDDERFGCHEGVKIVEICELSVWSVEFRVSSFEINREA